MQAYKLTPDTLKTAITLPGELETLTTADGSPMHIIGHATITIHLKNLRVTHHFILVKSLMTDVILGIDFQREYRISYDSDEEKWCYIRYRGQILCYTEDMESGINQVSVAKTICIPPKHNGAISVSIKGHDIKTPTACFIGSQYTDTEVRLIDGVHDISGNATLQVLVINNSNHHVNFPKGMKIGHLEPPIDDLAQIPINSATTQPETIKPDSFTPPKYQLDATTQQQLDFLLRTFKDQFTEDKTTIGTTPLTQMSIDTGDSDPISQKPYPVTMKHYQWVKEEIDKLLEAGVIRNSHSSWLAPIIVVPKGDGGKHLVIDYRALNKVTRKFVWPMPKVEDIFSQLNGAKYFSTLDLRAGYHHIGLTTDLIPKTAFTSPFGKYEYITLPFGLAQAPAYFQELMTGVLKDLLFVMAYLDDIIIYSSTPEEHLEHIRTVFEKLCNAKLSMKLSKCHFFAKEIQYLGHILGSKGIKPVPAKTEAIKAMYPPVNPKQVHAFLRLVGYYRKFIKNFVKTVKPLTMLTRMDVKFEWKERHQNAFMELKEAIIQAPILQYPDTTKPYIMYTDASNNACGAQLSQTHDGAKFPVAFLSHTFTDTQRRWSTPEQEAYGIYFAVKKWNYYLQGADIIARNDHKPLAQFLNGKNENTKINRWGLELASYNITFEWICRARNKAADCLSQLVELPEEHLKNQNGTKSAQINMVRAVTTRSRTRKTLTKKEIKNPRSKETNSDNDTTSNNSPNNFEDTSIKEMQLTDPFCKHIVKQLLNKTAPEHELKTFFIHNGLLYRYASDHSKDFCALVIPKAWRYTIPVETHDKMGHQGNNQTYSLIK